MKKPILYRIVRPFIKIWFKITYRPTFINHNIIPKKGRAILAGTHVSKKDVFIVLSSTKRSVRGVAKDELFNGPFKFFFKGMGAIPVNRRIEDKTVVPACVNILNEDGLVGIMPEGTINRTDDIIMPFKTGAVRMAIESNSPIIPFAIVGEYKAFKKSVRIVFGEPYHPVTTDVETETKRLENKVIALIQGQCEG